MAILIQFPALNAFESEASCWSEALVEDADRDEGELALVCEPAGGGGGRGHLGLIHRCSEPTSSAGYCKEKSARVPMNAQIRAEVFRKSISYDKCNM